MSDLYALTERDVDRLRALLTAWDEGRLNPRLAPERTALGEPIWTHLVKTTSSVTAASGTTPGSGTADYWNLSTGGILTDSTIATDVYNPTTQTIPSGAYGVVIREPWSGQDIFLPYASLEVKDVSGTPDVSGVTQITVNTTTGLHAVATGQSIALTNLAASATQTGVVTTGTQTIVGDKTFTSTNETINATNFTVSATTTTIGGGDIYISANVGNSKHTRIRSHTFSFPVEIVGAGSDTAIVFNPGTTGGLSSGPSTIYFDNNNLLYLQYTPSAGALGGPGNLVLQNYSTDTGTGGRYASLMTLLCETDPQQRSSVTFSGYSSLGTHQRMRIFVTDDTGAAVEGGTVTSTGGATFVSGLLTGAGTTSSVTGTFGG